MFSSPWMWVALAVALLLQNFSFTVVSRARNSGSDAFHAVAAVFSNAIWVVVNVILFRQWMEVWETGSVLVFAGVAAFYTVFTVLGSVYGGRISRRFFETGNRRVGHYDERERKLGELDARLYEMELAVMRMEPFIDTLRDERTTLTVEDLANFQLALDLASARPGSAL